MNRDGLLEAPTPEKVVPIWAKRAVFMRRSALQSHLGGMSDQTSPFSGKARCLLQFANGTSVSALIRARMGGCLTWRWSGLMQLYAWPPYGW